MAARRDRRGERDPLQLAFLLLLLARLWEQYQRLPVKPGPITTALVLVMVVMHLVPELAPPVRSVCISSSMWHLLVPDAGWATWLLGRRSLQERATEAAKRLVFSSLLHVDDLHLYYNLASLLWKGTTLEESMGAERYGGFVLYGVLASGALAVGLGRAAEALQLGTLHCAIGFSGVLYAMSALMALTDSPDRPAHVHGIPVRRRHAVWVEVVVSSLLHQHVSFLGHLGGAAAGALWHLAPSAAASARNLHLPRGRAATQQPRFRGGGRVGGNSGRRMYTPVD